MKQILCIALCTLFLTAQNKTITVYAEKVENKVAQFERDVISNLFALQDKKSKTTTTINFIDLPTFQDAFKRMDENVKTNLKNTSFAINKISYTDERAAKYDFSIPYMLNYYSIMTLQNRTALHKEVKFNANYIYGAVTGTIFHDKVKELSKTMNLKYKEYPSVKEMNDALQNQAVDFIITDYVDSWEYGLKSLFFYDNTTDRLCILLPKGSTLKKDLDGLLRYYLKSQQFFKLVKEYFGNDAVRFFKKSRN